FPARKKVTEDFLHYCACNFGHRKPYSISSAILQRVRDEDAPRFRHAFRERMETDLQLYWIDIKLSCACNSKKLSKRPKRWQSCRQHGSISHLHAVWSPKAITFN